MSENHTATVDILIRFKNSAATLPRVIEHLENQTYPPTNIIGVDTGSTDGSAEIIRRAGGTVVSWDAPYSHPKVLNFGLGYCRSELVVVLSSHTVLLSPDTIERMVAVMANPAMACVSAKWDDDPYYSDAISWDEMRAKGLKVGSIYSNSMGMLRHSFWQATPFDETMEGSEDYAWAISQLRLGHLCGRMDFPFDYLRSSNDRHHELARSAFLIARRNGLRPAWLGARCTFQNLIKAVLSGDKEARSLHGERLRAWWDVRRGR
ncbi:glycosyltransferase family 2 protein [Luteolibacter yonseiensis]|uniref:Glycosyltransferase family 2 protein n=1 Tax=Luteolibacter yonseiensis TaxID=1144680 RepID=A0A934R6P6_9BACT|nr:glycosyltransferase family 2 protein [Luteolibacter yonseiensis]MBK1817964.1 glycosyltransferase family 2 protein [Luteolibacter yonseiensis]